MQNPFRTEASAFRFVVAVIVYLGLIVLASWLGGTWAGVGVFVVLSAVGMWWFLRPTAAKRPVPTAPPHRGAPDERRILVVANETVGGTALRETIRQKTADGSSRVFVIAPALNSPVRQWTSDEDDARRAAQQRLDTSLARLREAGIEAHGDVADADPLQAIEDALRLHGADEIVVATHPEGRSSWLERGVVGAAEEQFALPITHVVVDLESEREEVR